MKLADRYLLEEILAPFVVGVSIVLVMLLGDHLYNLLEKRLVHGVDLVTIGRLLLFILPEMMVIAFPLATILAVSLGLNRLVREREWSSLRLGGWSLGRMLVPLVVFGLGVGALSWLVAEHIAPRAKKEYLTIYTRLSLADPTMVVQPESWFQSPDRERWFFVERVEPETGTMRHLVVFADLQQDFPTVLMARTARLEGDRFTLRDVRRHSWRADGSLQRESVTERVDLFVHRLAPQVLGQISSATEMSSAQLRRLIGELHQQGVKRPDQVLELHRRYTIPVACFLLALLCVPLNLLTGGRGGFAGLLIASILVIVYFLTHQLGLSLARDGALQRWPILGVWLQNIVFGLVTLVLLRRCR